ncbi:MULTISPECIES: FAD-dependent oxidoreductase [unclassified Brevibacterium]|uniref:NAD(P)/FAD-dependent oxidoreductase n=1 Tax=unclassified Brevibacterium TaxID=2614124 RepID=UPI00362A1ACA
MTTLTSFEQAEASADRDRIREALADAKREPFWFDDHPRQDRPRALEGDLSTDLLVVGGGFSGLWTALKAKERKPDREVVLIEAETVGWAASGRNGGFCEPSLTHGRANAARHLPGEESMHSDMGVENLEGLLADLERYGIDCDIDAHGVIKLATEEHQEESLRALAASEADVELLTGQDLQDQVRTAAASTGAWAKADGVVLNPAKLVLGLLDACRRAGVRVFENTRVDALKEEPAAGSILATTGRGRITAKQVVLATNGFSPLVRRQRLRTVPVYDYAVVTEPLSAAQEEEIGWKKRQGLTDLNNRFHYLRKIVDSEGRTRILIGGYDALYHYGRAVRPELEVSEPTFERLAVHLGVFFPSLSGVKFTHAWGGMIDTCSRFFAFFALSHHGRVAYASGFTGLGVAATRFAADAMLDLLEGADTRRTRSRMVRTVPMPFPPEPFAWAAITFTASQMARSDRRGGKRGLWLSVLDRLKLGFDS